MTTETAEQPRHEDGDHQESLTADAEQMSHAQLDDANSATDSDADDSAPEPDDQDAALQQAHSEARRRPSFTWLCCQPMDLSDPTDRKNNVEFRELLGLKPIGLVIVKEIQVCVDVCTFS